MATNEIKAVEVAQAAEIDAILRNDLEALDRLWSDDLLMSSNQSLIFTKKQVFRFFQRGLVQLEKLDRTISKSIVKGDTVFLIGNQQAISKLDSAAIGVPAGVLVMSSFMAGWAREDGAWKLDALVEPLKPALAFTLGAMGSATTNFYNDAFKRGGWEAAGREVQRLWVAGKRPEAVAKVPPEMVIQANLLGDTEMVRKRIRAYKDAGVTTLRVAPQGRDLAERLTTLGRVMDLIRAVKAGS